MARKKRPRKLRPKTPARVRKQTRRRRAGAHQHPELIGLGLAAFGLFLGSVLYAGWNGGYVGKAIGDGVDALVGGTAYVLPIAAFAVGALMVAKSDLPRFGPFRTGLVVTTFGLALVLGRAHGGYFGRGLDAAFGSLIGSTGAHLLGGFLLLAGCLLVSGASAGAFLRGDRVMRFAAPRAGGPPVVPRRSRQLRLAGAGPWLPLSTSAPPVDGEQEFPDVVAPTPLLTRARARRSSWSTTSPRSSTSPTPDEETVYTLPDRGVLRRSKPAARGAVRVERTDRRDPRPGTRELRRRRDRRRRDLRAPGHPLRAPARTRHEGGEGGGAQGRPLLCARDDRDPDPGADPGQAGGRRRGPEPFAEPRHARRHLRRPPGDAEPALGLARQGHLRQRGVDRPRADAASPDRRHDRLGQVGLHQRDPHLDPAARRRPTRCA